MTEASSTPVSFEERLALAKTENSRYLKYFAEYPESKAAKIYEALCQEHGLKDIEEADPIYAFHILRDASGCRDSSFSIQMRNALAGKFGDISKIGTDLVRAVIARVAERKEWILGIDLAAPRLSSLEDFTITETRKGKVTQFYDFCPLTEALVNAYGFDFRGIFGDIENAETNRVLEQVMGFSRPEMEHGRRTAPTTGDLCAMAYYVLRQYTYDLVPYVDHWHHLLELDFVELRRGGKNYMSIDSDGEDPVFAKIRAIYALECLGSDPSRHDDHITFTVDW